LASGSDQKVTFGLAKKDAADAVTLPVVASGGAGTREHFYEVAVCGKAEILPASSVFHFRLLSIRGVKGYLRDRGIGGSLS